ncbi:hypothetical protein J2Y03_005271 [Neobacillus niacini]|nr:hypothetical protein [Neobacillus niacini]
MEPMVDHIQACKEQDYKKALEVEQSGYMDLID